MKRIITNGITNLEPLPGSSEWYWGSDYASNDLYEAEELFRSGHPIDKNRLVLIHRLEGTVYEPVCTKPGQYSPVWPDGKKHSRNVYAKTREECEEKLKVLILEMKAEIAALRSGASTEYPDGVSPKKKAIAAYLREHPGVTSKSLIARELQMDRSTVQR